MSLFPKQDPFISCRNCKGHGIVPRKMKWDRNWQTYTCPQCAKAYRELVDGAS